MTATVSISCCVAGTCGVQTETRLFFLILINRPVLTDLISYGCLKTVAVCSWYYANRTAKCLLRLPQVPVKESKLFSYGVDLE